MSNVATLSRPESESKNQTTWLIDGMLPIGHKGMIACPVGSCKTTLLSWIAVCVALGKPVFGMMPQQGAVLMIDEETPTQTLEKKLYRFCLENWIITRWSCIWAKEIYVGYRHRGQNHFKLAELCYFLFLRLQNESSDQMLT